MKKTMLYGVRLAVAIAAVALAVLACQSVLDFDGLKSKTPVKEAGVKEGGSGDVVIVPDKPRLPDTGKCVSGAPCSVTGKFGECAAGKAKCFEGGPDGTCEQTVQPVKEACDGKDGDCDNTPDVNDPDACTGENYCKPGTPPACTPGCAANANCTNGNSCDTTAHSCKCGGTGPRCSGAQTCDATSKTCKCGTKKLSCGPNENCEGGTAGAGACMCGTTKNENGPACTAPQTCLGSSTSKSCGIKTDGGPDKGPVVDKGPDKTPAIDKSIVDKPPTQIDKAVIDKAPTQIDKAPTIDKTPIDKAVGIE